MTKKVWLALLLALTMAVSCLSAVAQSTDLSATEPAQTAEPAATPEPAATAQPPQEDAVMLSINGDAIMTSEASALYQTYLQQYQSYGMDFSDEANQQALMNLVMNTLLQERLIRQKAVELGLDTFTEEEEASMREEAQSTYDKMFEMYLKYLGDENKSDEENRQAITEQLEGYDYTVDNLLKSQKDSEVFTRVYDYTTQGVEIPDAAVQTAYDQGVEDAKAKYAQDLTAYGTDRNGGATIFYTPAGYRTVKHILVTYEKAAELKELKEKLAAMSESDAEYASTKAQIDEMMQEIQPKLDEIQGKINAGEDFQALIDEYGEDGGMKSGTTAETGYYLCEGNTTYVPEFTAGGLALEKVGDVSEPVLTDYGFHIIRYNSDVPEAVTPFEEIQEELKTQLLNEALNAAYNSKMNEWAQAAVIEYPQAATAGQTDPEAEPTAEPAA